MTKFYFSLSFTFVFCVHVIVLMYDDNGFKSVKKSYQISVNAVTDDANDKNIPAKNNKKRASVSSRASTDKNSSLEQDGIISDYLNKVIALIEAHKDYPLLSKALGEEGIVNLDFTINSEGKVEKVLVKSKSSFERLNQAAINAIYRVKSYPRFPKTINKNHLDLALSLKFLSQP